MAAIDWTDICRKYKGLYVAVLEEDGVTVIATGATFREALENARRDSRHTFVSYVPEEITLSICTGHEFSLSNISPEKGVKVTRPTREAANHPH